MTVADPSLDDAVALAARAETRRHPGLVIGACDTRTGQRTVVGVGHTRLPDGPAPQANTLFEIGSITKVFTGLLLAIGVVRGEVALDTPIGALLPTGPALPDRDGRQITMEHLATHRSGLPRSPVSTWSEIHRGILQGSNPYQGLDAQRVLDIVAGTRLRRTPGTGRIAYSNLGAGLLGLGLVAAAGASSYGDLVRTRICAPLGMTDTSVLADADPERLADGHRSRHRPVEHWTLTGVAGAGALLSSARDMLTFLTAQLEPGRTPLAEAITLSQQPRHHDRGFRIGLGWIMTSDRSRVGIVWHNGGTGGFRSFAGFRPDHQTAVVMLANGRKGPERAALHLLSKLRQPGDPHG